MRHRGRALTIGVAVAGIALVGVLGPGGAAGASDERVLRLNASQTSVPYMDPALNYDFIGWRLEFMTCARLLTYPDKPGAAGARLAPEAARSMPTVSRDGKTYSFVVRRGLRFSDGSSVTPRSFVRALERALAPRMHSPAAGFVADIVGANAVSSGKRSTPSGVTVQGDRLTISLARPAPDFLSRIAMVFFCAVPDDLPHRPARGADAGRGRAVLCRGVQGQRADRARAEPVLPGKPAPAMGSRCPHAEHEHRGKLLQVRRGEVDLDLAGLPPAANTELTRRYDINKGRYFVHPGLILQYIALNTSRPLFRDETMRQAVAYAIDRTFLMRAAGLNGGVVNDQLLPPGLPGYEPVTIYPNRPNLAKARKLIAGRTAKATLYAGNDPTSRSQAEILRQSLGAIGIDLKVRIFPFAVQLAKAGKRGEPFDLNLIGWFADYPDPYDFINVLLHGRTIEAANNVNTAYFDDPAFNRRMDKAKLLAGDARLRAYATLDRDLTRAAPLVVFGNPTVREYVSERIGCPVYSVPSGGLNLTMLCLKK